MKVAPSILSANFLMLKDDIKMLNKCADYIHLDIMDGQLVPNISFGFSVIDQLGYVARIPMDAHLMVYNPERWFKQLADDEIRMISFHYEAAGSKTNKFIDEIHDLGLKAGVAIDPDVPVSKLYKYIGKADYFLIMSVFAGFGGQQFIYETIDKVKALKHEIVRKGADALIEVDGGVNLDNVKALAEAGADIVVAGNAVFKADDPMEAVKALQEA